MDPFTNAPDFILDLIFLKLNEEDLHETLRVSKSWFWASIRRTKKLKITGKNNPLKTMAKFYNKKRPTNEKMDWKALFKHLVLNELIVIGDTETTNYLVNNGCNTAMLYIEASEGESPVTLASLKKVSRLQSFELKFYWKTKWHPFIAECFQSSDSGFDPNIQFPIMTIKLNSIGWNTEDSILHSITKLSLSCVTIAFVRPMVDHCPNLEELHCSWGYISERWHRVFPANVKRIEFHDFGICNSDAALVVDGSTDSARNLLPYLCQNWEAVEKFHFDNYSYFGRKVYEAFPQDGEEVLVCPKFNEEMNLGSPLFQSREISVKCDGRTASRLHIPPTKSVKFTFDVERYFKFSPRAVCSEPDKVEHLSLSLKYTEGCTPEPFRPSFRGFCCLTSLTLSHVSALTMKMALDQCPSIKKLKLKYLEASTIGKIPRGSRYANVDELVLDECKEPITKVFKVFPCLSKFKLSAVFGNHEMREKKTDLLRRHLIREHKKYGLVFEKEAEIRFVVSDDLQPSLNEAQMMLNECFQCKCFLKGFKLIRRVPKQKVCYIK